MDPPEVTIEAPLVVAPPDSFFEMIEDRLNNPRRRSRRSRSDRDPTSDEDSATKAARIQTELQFYRAFYQKYLEVNGLPVAAHQDVSDLALQRTHEIVSHMLAGRPDILESMAQNQTYLIVIGKNQVYTDMPEYRHHPNPDFMNERVRGTGGNPTSFGEENLLCLPIDRYDDESIAVHEFCHTIDSTLRRIDPTWTERRNAAFESAREKGLYHQTYAAGSAGEYWAEIAQAYFDCQRVNNWNHGPIGRREQLRVYDPTGYDLCRRVFNLGPDQDWRYRWLQPLPMVSAPPRTPMFAGIAPWYTKFTWAREFTIVGRGADDAALLRANEIIRRMFAYRHDILKALIYDGVKLVVLGPNESLAELPEYRGLEHPEDIDHTLRWLPYHPKLKTLVVDQNHLMAPSEGHQVIRLMAEALYQVTATRAHEPDYQGNQQYELRVQRMDERFDSKLERIYQAAMSSEKWRNTAAVHNKVQYWTNGVLAYFDAAAPDGAPIGQPHPITTREDLRNYDPRLFELVNQTMAYDGKIDWRLSP